ncbi:hypothetical protein [Arachidicoccus sp.]|uniref:hypothetical protein n=1 Tax=Arachidicoccus sp. TaxID=1872624 RepID=UPI003D21134E
MQHPLQETERAILKRKGKFFLALPIIVLPFITLLLWSMGFIGKQKTVVHSSKQDGPNLSLPQARPNADSN